MKIPRKIVGVLTGLLTIGLLINPVIAEAHVLKEDNGVSSVLHIDPDDNPVAGIKTSLDFDFGNTSGDFSLNDYHIALNVTENNKSVQAATVSSAYFGSTSQGIAYVTFPGIDVYQLLVTGTPTVKNVASFKVDYLIRVASSVHGSRPSQSSSGTVLLLSATSLVLLIMCAIYVIHEGKRYAKDSKKKSKKEKVV